MNASPASNEATTAPQLADVFTRLAEFTPRGVPVLSLYLDARTDQHGQRAFGPFLRRTLQERIDSFPAQSAARDSLERDAARVLRWIDEQLPVSARALAIFACAAGSADGLFETVPLDTPIEDSEIHVQPVPHLYTLARLLDAHPRSAVVVLDTRRARILVIGLQRVESRMRVANDSPSRTDVGGWSQARYQRHVDHLRRQHVQEVVDVLDRVVREDAIAHVVLAGDAVVLPLLRDALPKPLAAKVVDVLSLDVRAPEHAVLEAAVARLREEDARDDVDAVARLLDAARGGGLGVLGARDTVAALRLGQVDRVLVSRDLQGEPRLGDADAREHEDLASQIVTLAGRTDASVRFIEDAELLRHVGGVGAILRYRLAPERATAEGAAV
jgi:peptide chain release factor subunit 1